MSRSKVHSLRVPQKGNSRRAVMLTSIVSVLAILLFWHFVTFLSYAAAALRYPFSLDYGEGIVWQQMMLIPGPHMYGNIAKYPFIVFQYPPFYYLVVRAVAALGLDPLAAGRAVSISSTLIAAGCVTALSYQAVRSRPRTVAFVGAAMAGLSVFCFGPVVSWSAFMRVDMLAVALSLFGVVLALHAPGRRYLLELAALAFVLAIYTKQTCIIAPLATLPVAFLSDRTRTIKAMVLGGLVAVGALMVLMFDTHGRFLEHIIIYNINRFDLSRILTRVEQQHRFAGFFVLSVLGLFVGWRECLRECACTGWGDRAVWLVSNTSRRNLATMTLYYLLLSLGLIALGKSGSAANYFIEWMFAGSVGLAIVACSAMTSVLLPRERISVEFTPITIMVLLTLFAFSIVSAPICRIASEDPGSMRGLTRLVSQMRAAPKPVFSEDMTLLLRAGKQVPWEPAIITELSDMGMWNQQRIITLIEGHFFSFMVTKGYLGERLPTSHYTPAVRRAIEKSYPVEQSEAGFVVHRPVQ